MSEKEELLSKLQKIFALSESDNPNEANNAAVMAQSWLLKYNISEQELKEFSAEKSEAVTEVKTSGKTQERRSTWYSRLANVIAEANLCYLLTSGPDLIWIGKPSNIEVARFIFANLVRELTRMCERDWYFSNTNVHGKTWKNNYYIGAIQSIRTRLSANLLQLKTDNTNLALIVRNDEEVKEFVRTNHRVRTIHVQTRMSRDAFDQGKAAGQMIPFTKGIGSGGSLGPKLIGSGNANGRRG